MSQHKIQINFHVLQTCGINRLHNYSFWLLVFISVLLFFKVLILIYKAVPIATSFSPRNLGELSKKVLELSTSEDCQEKPLEIVFELSINIICCSLD